MTPAVISASMRIAPFSATMILSPVFISTQFFAIATQISWVTFEWARMPLSPNCIQAPIPAEMMQLSADFFSGAANIFHLLDHCANRRDYAIIRQFSNFLPRCVRRGDAHLPNC
jgi:hypothetical protein